MKCTNCGEQVPDTAKVCGYCGHVLKKDQGHSIDSGDRSTTNKRTPTWLKWVIAVGAVFLALLIGLIVMGAIRRNRTQALTDDMQMEIGEEPAPLGQRTATADITYTQAAATVEVLLQQTRESTPTQREETATVEATKEPDEKTNSKDGAEMVYVPAGEFLMGASEDDFLAEEDEKPQRTVLLDGFWIYKHEVSNTKYRSCIEAGICSGSLNRYPADTLPAAYISSYEAEAYCSWVDGRLPTEAEWEKAARGVGTNLFPWGDEQPNCGLANFEGCVGFSSVTGSYPDGVSSYGVEDMAGNVWEWVSDWYSSSYYQQNGESSNPSGPDGGEYRVIRGGGWGSPVEKLRVSERGWVTPNWNQSTVGFRCVVVP